MTHAMRFTRTVLATALLLAAPAVAGAERIDARTATAHDLLSRTRTVQVELPAEMPLDGAYVFVNTEGGVRVFPLAERVPLQASECTAECTAEELDLSCHDAGFMTEEECLAMLPPPPPTPPGPEYGVSGGGIRSGDGESGESGCSAAPGSDLGDAGAVLLGLLGVTLILSRRRWTRLGRLGGTTAAAGALALFLVATPAQAQSIPDEDGEAQGADQFAIERFRLSSDRDGMFNVEWAAAPRHLEWDLSLWFGASNDPLIVYVEENGERERVGALVSRRMGGTIMAALGLFGWAQVSIDVPLVVSQSQEDLNLDPALMPPADLNRGDDEIHSFGFGHPRLTVKVQVLNQEDHWVNLALIPSIELPVGLETDYVGGDGMGFIPQAAASHTFDDSWRLAANFGYRSRTATRIANLEVEDELFGSIGLGYRLPRDMAPIEFDVTLAGATSAESPFGEFNQDYLEALGGLTYGVPGPVSGFVATGFGLNPGYGAPDWRAVLGVRMGPDRPTKGSIIEVPVPVVENDPFATGDADQDGVIDGNDQCPADPEDLDGYEDKDGCPDMDNDKDAVADALDGCVNTPGPAENGGCPDTDRDGDGIADRLDNCPDKPGEEKYHGCTQEQLAYLAANAIVLVDNVYFAFDKAEIEPRSSALLDNVAAIIMAHPELALIKIEGHADHRGTSEYNAALSQRRAQAVADYLVSRGVPRDRVDAVAYGEGFPRAKNTEEGMSVNRRVEFRFEAPFEVPIEAPRAAGVPLDPPGGDKVKRAFGATDPRIKIRANEKKTEEAEVPAIQPVDPNE